LSTVKERRHWRRHGGPAEKTKPLTPAEQNAWAAATAADGTVRCSNCHTVLVGFRGRDYSLRRDGDRLVVACGTGPVNCGGGEQP
jgi:hypothetical protein